MKPTTDNPPTGAHFPTSINSDFQVPNSPSSADADVDPDAPLCIGMDYNANINRIIAGQPKDRSLNVVKSFYVKFERKIPALIADFCDCYRSHRNKTIIHYHDATALNSNYAVNDQDVRWWVIHGFERHGWQVEAVYLGNPMRHDEKYLLINQAFAGRQRLMPFFNRQNNDDLILAIQAAGVARGRNGFRKDKAGEKLAESEDREAEARPDRANTSSNTAPTAPTRFLPFGRSLRGRYPLYRRREIPRSHHHLLQYFRRAIAYNPNIFAKFAL